MATTTDAPSIVNLLKPADETQRIEARVENYRKYFDDNQEQRRKEHSMDVTNNYYDIATDFYEYGWGESFHFAVLQPGESRDHSLAKHEYTLALKLDMKPQDSVLDLGCGIGGPARHLAIFSGAKIVGLNCNDYQVNRAINLTKKQNLDHLCTFVKGDFNSVPFEESTFDKVYAIEATCHSDDLSRVYGEAFRVLKPGGMFGVYEWVMTEKYDAGDPHHRRLKRDIMEGSGLADAVTMSSALESMKKVGFEIVEASDRATASPVPWYSTLQPSWSLSGFRGTSVGRWLTDIMLVTLESVRLAPRGSVTVHRTLCKGADGLVAAGVEGIFTPMFLMIGRKPR